MPAPTTDVSKQLETLGLKPDDLNEDAIRVSYKKLALQWHPDRHNADPEEAKEKFIEVNAAYMALVDECKKRNKRKKTRKDEDSSSPRRPFWAGSTPSASTSTSSTPSSSSSRNSHTSASTSTSTTKETGIPTRKPEDSRTTKPAHSRSAKSTQSPSAKSGDIPRTKSSDRHAAKRADTRKEETSRSGDRDPSHSSSHKERSSHTARHPARPRRSSNLPPETDIDSSSEEGSLHNLKHSHRHTSDLKGKKSKSLLGEDDYEFIDLGTPLKPLGSPKPLSSSKDWIFPLHLTLEDLYFGTTHRYRITRTLLSHGARPHARSNPASSPAAGKSQTVKIEVRVAPGWRAGTHIRVPGVGNQHPDGSFQDIVFVVAEAPHPRFARTGDDLVLPVRVPWVEAHPQPCPPHNDDLCGDDDSMLGHGDAGRYKFGWGPWHHHESVHEQAHGDEADEVYVLGMNGEEYTLPIPRTLVEAADGTRISGAGMPVRRNGKVVGKGDLVIRWEFAFLESDKQRSRWQTLMDAMHLRFQV